MDLFQRWDINQDGDVSKHEFRRAIPELGLWTNEAEVDELFQAFDVDNSGSISFRELNKMLRRTRDTDEASKARLNPVAGV